MSPKFILSALAGEQGDDTQFEAVKFEVKNQIDNAFGLFLVKGGNNMEVRETLHGYFVSYNERGSGQPGRRG